jgi:hypothetical protein
MRLRHKLYNSDTSYTTQTQVIRLRHKLYDSDTSYTTQTQVIQLRHKLYDSDTSYTTQTPVIRLRHKLYDSDTSYTTQTVFSNTCLWICSRRCYSVILLSDVIQQSTNQINHIIYIYSLLSSFRRAFVIHIYKIILQKIYMYIAFMLTSDEIKYHEFKTVNLQ